MPGFTAYLLSEECDLFDVTHDNVVHDMTLPLSHYFIASSHHTYVRINHGVSIDKSQTFHQLLSLHTYTHLFAGTCWRTS